jgi:hypothetical protein
LPILGVFAALRCSLYAHSARPYARRITVFIIFLFFLTAYSFGLSELLRELLAPSHLRTSPTSPTPKVKVSAYISGSAPISFFRNAHTNFPDIAYLCIKRSSAVLVLCLHSVFCPVLAVLVPQSDGNLLIRFPNLMLLRASRKLRFLLQVIDKKILLM